jgi:hypothetical protein
MIAIKTDLHPGARPSSWNASSARLTKNANSSLSISATIQRHAVRLAGAPTKQAFDYRLKACLDLLVTHRVIERDDAGIVRKTTVEVSDTGEPGARVLVEPIPSPQFPPFTRCGTQ